MRVALIGASGNLSTVRLASDAPKSISGRMLPIDS
jgi:hypothetical protein